MFATNYCHRMNYIMLTSPHYCTSPVPLAQIDLSDCPVIWQQKAASSLLPSPRLRPPAAQSLPPRSAPVRHFAMRSGQPNDRFSMFRNLRPLFLGTASPWRRTSHPSHFLPHYLGSRTSQHLQVGSQSVKISSVPSIVDRFVSPCRL